MKALALEALHFLQQQWVLLSLMAALGYAAIGFVDEWLLHRHGTNDDGFPEDAAGKLIIISGLFGFAVSGLFALVAALNGDGSTIWGHVNSIFLAMAAGAFEIIWLVPYFYAMQRAGAINATPLFQSVPAFSLLLGITLFNEIPPISQIIGSLLIASGAFILNFNFYNRRFDWITTFLMSFSSIMISLEYFFFKDAALDMGFVPSAFWTGLGMVFAAGLIWVLWPPYRRQFKSYLAKADKQDIGVQIGNEGLNAASALASQLAVVRGPSVMLVSAFNAFHPLFTLLIGWALAKLGSQFHNDELKGGKAAQKGAAIALIALGTAMVALWD